MIYRFMKRKRYKKVRINYNDPSEAEIIVI